MVQGETDMLNAMMPAGLSIDEEETLRARMGIVDVAPVEDFAGGYAETAEQAVARATGRTGAKKAPKLERGLKDVIITMPLADRDEFAATVTRLRRRLHADSTADVVLAALRALEDAA